jgi:small GTP-binding protein
MPDCRNLPFLQILSERSVGQLFMTAEFKLVLLGDSGVGKTTIIRRRSGSGGGPIVPTIGCAVDRIVENVAGRELVIQLWDTAGQERFQTLVPMYIRSARAVVVVYDVMEMHSFESLEKWISYANSELTPPYKLEIVANKCDCVTDEQPAAVDRCLASALANANNAGFYEVSAVTGLGISELFSDIAQDILMLSGDNEPDFVQKLVKETENGSSCSC